MSKRQIRKFCVLAGCGGVVFQLAGCASGLLNGFIQDAIGLIIGGLITNLIQGVTDATNMTA